MKGAQPTESTAELQLGNALPAAAAVRTIGRPRAHVTVCAAAGLFRRAGFEYYFITSEGSFWNGFEVIFFLSVFWMVYATYRFWQDSRDILAVLEDTDRWVDRTSEHASDPLQFTDMMNYQKLMRTVMRNLAIVTILGMFKIFKYMSLSPSLNFMWSVVLAARQVRPPLQ